MTKVNSKKDNSGPAFPVYNQHGFTTKQELVDDKECTGLTVRDYFAAQAIIGLFSHPNGPAGMWPIAAKHAYELADAMLEERNSG